MTKPPINPSVSKSKALLSLEYALLFLALCVLALRTIYAEGPAVQSTNLPTSVSDQLYSLSISACLLAAFLLWIVWNICSRRFFYRPTGMETGLVLFIVAGVISCFAASDNRLAITNVTVLIAPIFIAVLLVQVLDSQARVNFVLAVIAALGVLSAYQCFEQLFAGNAAMIQQYKENPQSLLGPLGIEPNTLEHFLFEDRLYAQNVRAFFTTRNSAGSFLLLSFFAVLTLCIRKFKSRQPEQSPFRQWIFCGILAAALLAALALTKSKGAIIGLFFAGFLLAVFVRFRDWLKVHRKAILTVCIFFIVAGGLTIAWYGVKYNRLPGGNSMLVRWQYWRATAQMVAHHPLTGVGPGNFTFFYPRYKPAGALESISDPHNFLLSILSQYGPLGLVGFLAVMVLPLWKIIFPKASVSSEAVREQPLLFKTNVITTIIVVWVGLLLVQLFIGPATGSSDFAVLIYLATRFFIPAFVIFTIALLLFRDQAQSDGRAKRDAGKVGLTAAILFCALLGVVLHSMTDFAIFEPGVNTTFWTMLACLVAVDSFTKPKREVVLTPAPVIKVLSIVLAIVLAGAFLNYAFVPVAASTAKIEQANSYISTGRFDQAHRDLDEATALDKLSPVAPSLNARLYLHLYQQPPLNNREMLIRAEQCLKTAIERNKADFKNYDRLSQVYVTLSEITTGQESTDWLDKAFTSASDSVKLYPGRGKLHFNLAQIAVKLGNTDIALEQYEDTVNIENQYRDQFRQMFPKRKVVSRLGEEKYQIALERIKELSND